MRKILATYYLEKMFELRTGPVEVLRCVGVHFGLRLRLVFGRGGICTPRRGFELRMRHGPLFLLDCYFSDGSF